MKKIIAMSLYGAGPQYIKGAVANARLVPEVYPGWTMRVYYHLPAGTKELKQLSKLGCELQQMPCPLQQSGMFWRFLAAWDKDSALVIIRDTDSRLNFKEAAAVQQWEESGLMAHCMHDHLHHRSHPIFGGMWGIRTNVLRRGLRRRLARDIRISQPRVADMRWLARWVLPEIENSLMRHSSIEVRWPYQPFPDHPEISGFVGQQYDENGKPVIPI